MRFVPTAMATISLACHTVLAQSIISNQQANRALAISWYTRTLPTTDVDLLIGTGPPPLIPKEALTELNPEARLRLVGARRNGSVLKGMIWYQSSREFASAYIDSASGVESIAWEEVISDGLSALPVGAAACGRTNAFAWNSESGNLLVVPPNDIHPALASRLRHLEFIVEVDVSPEDAFAALIANIGIDGETKHTESDRQIALAWLSSDGSLSVFLEINRTRDDAVAAGPYSWTMTAVDSARELSTVTTAEVRPAPELSLSVPSTQSDLPNVYKGLVGLSLVPGEFVAGSPFVGGSEVLRRLLGIAVFVVVLSLLVARKDQS